ncbi:MAG: sensor histidine kinase, partial [Cyclobacteriaceae bacterium]|nr:sensor histidine kinase [Cyclobacteriaceae bacterium]
TEYSPLEMLHFAARIFHMDGDSDHLLARCYMELGLNYRNDYQYNPETRDSIIYYYTLAKQYADQAGDFHISNEIKNDIADYYLLKPQINPDTVILLSSQVFQSTHSNLKNKAVAYLNAYLAKKIKGETDSLFHYLFTGYSLTNKIKPSRLQRQSAELLYQYYLDKEMYDSALFYFIKEKQTNIKLSSNYNYLSLLFDNKDKEAKIAEQQNVIISANLKRQQIFIYILIAGTILSLIFTAIIIRKNSVIKLKSHELQKKNDQIESLIKEIHHRVKNNLQMIVGLLDLQESSIKDTAVSLVLNDASSRIKSIALIHQKLYSGDTDMINIGFHHYMEELCDNLIYSYDLMDKIEVRLDIDEIETSFDRAVIFGLLTTELITNVLKHAFKGVENGYIELKVKKGTSHDLVLSVKDNGVGMSTDLNKKTDSFGLDLIQSFVSDLEGEIKFINNGGTTVEVKLAHFIYKTVD